MAIILLVAGSTLFLVITLLMLDEPGISWGTILIFGIVTFICMAGAIVEAIKFSGPG